MNSEELEVSLRTEFESYLKGVFAEMRQDVADFQKNFEAEFEKHRTQMDDAFRKLSTRFDSDAEFDRAFTESVVEHLRLARDDGAQLTAQAFAEAQALEESKKSDASANYDQLRDAINEISFQQTQSAILASLVDHVSKFTPRGAFFIVKNDNFVCWRKFDGDGHAEDDSVRAIHFPLESDTLLARAVNNRRTEISSAHSEDGLYLNELGFGRPEGMYAVPLMARGRGVAVLYADRGDNGGDVNVEAIETMVRVAGLTVELRAAAASTQPAKVEENVSADSEADETSYAWAPVESSQDVEEEKRSYDDTPQQVVEESSDALTPASEEGPDAVEEYTGAVAVEEVEEFESHQAEEVVTPEETEYFEPVPVEQEESESEMGEYASADNAAEETPEPERVNDFAFASSDSYDASAPSESEPVEEYAYSGETSNGTNGHSYEVAPEPVVEVSSAQPTKSRLSDRNVDLPIEVADEERRLHNEARRFARLLVSEIKLYNEQKVNEGRDASDLYDRLREAIDRSREMYDKRVQPTVAAKFDYFHYELVSNLAEGNDQRLGSSYPGASI